MPQPLPVAIDGNEAAARVAYLTNEIIAIYPITPASPMGEWADQWASEGRKNLWRTVPDVIEMQSEGPSTARCRAVALPPPSPLPRVCS